MNYELIPRSLSALPAVPTYRDVVKRNGFLLAPNDHFIVTIPLADGGTLNKTQVNAIKNGFDFLYAYGRINYRDTHGRRHCTQFGCEYHFPQGGMVNFQKAVFRIAGPPAYNQAD